MLLAEALNVHKTNEELIGRLMDRAGDAAQYQEGQPPQEDAMALTKQALEILQRQAVLESQIMLTNQRTRGPDGRTLSQMVTDRKRLRRETGIWRLLAKGAQIRVDRYSRSEIMMKTDIKVAEVQKAADDTAAAARKLDLEIQALNFTTELVTE